MSYVIRNIVQFSCCSILFLFKFVLTPFNHGRYFHREVSVYVSDVSWINGLKTKTTCLIPNVEAFLARHRIFLKIHALNNIVKFGILRCTMHKWNFDPWLWFHNFQSFSICFFFHPNNLFFAKFLKIPIHSDVVTVQYALIIEMLRIDVYWNALACMECINILPSHGHLLTSSMDLASKMKMIFKKYAEWSEQNHWHFRSSSLKSCFFLCFYFVCPKI